MADNDPFAPMPGRSLALTPGAQVKPIPSFMQRAAAGLRYALTGRDPNAGWFGPGEPRMPVAPPDVAGRQFDFPVGFNTRQNPRTDEDGITFAELRALADNLGVLRTVIETRKDQVCALNWRIHPKDKKAQADSRCIELEAFLAKPDREHTWATWLRMLLEDLFVIDAPTIYPRGTIGGDLYSLELVDGATIKRLLDDHGRAPMPPEPAYQQVLKGLPAVDYTLDELIYAPRNPRTWKVYGYSPVEQIIIIVNIALRREAFVLEYYQSGTVPDALASVPKEWNPKQIREFQEYWDVLLTGDLAARRKLRFIPDGVQFRETKQPPLKDQYDEWLARVVCFCFSIEPTPFVAQVNRAVAETSRQQSLAEGLGPIKKWVKDSLDPVIQQRLGAPDLEFQWVDEDAISPLDRAQIDKLYVDAKVLDPDEVRVDLGREPMTPEQRAKLAPPAPVAPPPGAAQQPPDDQQGATGKGAVAKRGKPVMARISRTRPVVAQAAHAIQHRLTGFFEDQARAIADQVGKALGNGKAGKGIDSEGLSTAQRRRLAEILADLDFSEWEDVVTDLSKWLVVVSKDGARESFAQLEVDTGGAALDQANERAVAWADARAAELVGKKWVDGELVDNPRAQWAITESTREFIRADVALAMSEGWSNDRIADVLAENYAFSDTRAEMVARTETARADIEGSLIAYREIGVVGKQWAVGSETDCDICEANADAGVLDLDDEFPDGTQGPPGHPNCVCDLIPVTATPENDE